MRLSIVALGAASVVAMSGCVTVLPASGAAAPAPSSAEKAHDQQKSAAVATPPNAARHLYRLDFVLSSGDASPAAGEHLTMNLLENDIGEIRNDMNLPLSNGTDPSRPTGPIGARVEVGTTLKANYTTLGDDLVLQTSTELSGTDEPGSIRKLSAHGDALVTPGKPALVASVDDASGHKRYELTVTATKLR